MRPFRCGPKKAGASKTPKRVKLALDLLEKIIWRHGKCSYKALRDIACSSKLKRPEKEAALDSSIILVCPFAQLRFPRPAFNHSCRSSCQRNRPICLLSGPQGLLTHRWNLLAPRRQEVPRINPGLLNLHALMPR